MEGEALGIRNMIWIMSEQIPILLYTPHPLVRFNYIASTILGEAINFTNSIETFISFDGFKINYSTNCFGNEQLHIVPHGLLEQTGVEPQLIDCFEWQGLTIFFKTNGSIPFDFFAASFYLLTRYEEYLPHTKDELGRYDHKNSLAFNKNFLHQPLIQLWVKQIAMINHSFFSVDTSWSFIPTYDIDIAYSYNNQRIFRNVFGFFKDFINGNSSNVEERLAVLGGTKKDPYDVYDWLDLLHSSLQLKPIYFFLLAANKKGLDKNIDPSSAAMKNLIAHHANNYEIGIHPSIQSTKNKNLLLNEITQLNNLIGKEVKTSRNHYINILFPNTYQELIQVKIKHDYSMGYPTINGFRASYAKPYQWFNLKENKVTALVVHTFCYMDATAIFQERIAVDKAASDLQYYFDTVKLLGGECITIFHNNFLTAQNTFKEWKDLYADFLLKNFTR